MPNSLKRVALSCLLLLGAFSFAQDQPKNSKNKNKGYDPSPSQLDTDLAWMTQQMAALNGQAAKWAISPDRLVAFLSADVTQRLELEKRAQVAYKRSHERMWEEFLKWLGAYPRDSNLTSAEPIIELTESKVTIGILNYLVLEKVHPELQKESVKAALDAFYASYRKMVLKNRRWPSSGSVGCCGFGSGDPYKEKLFKVTQMSIYIALASWTMEQFKNGEHLALVQREMAQFQDERRAAGFEQLTFPAFLDSYLELNEPDRAARLWPDPDSRSNQWLPFLKAIYALPRQAEAAPAKEDSFLQITPEKLDGVEVESEILDKTDLGPDTGVGAYLIGDVFTSFFEGYEKPLVKRMLTTRDKIDRMAEYITLGRWAIETWKREKREMEEAEKLKKAKTKDGNDALIKEAKDKWPKMLKSSNFTIKKGVLTLGGLVAAGAAVKFGVPAVWEAIFGTEGPGSEAVPSGKPEVEEDEGQEAYKEDENLDKNLDEEDDETEEKGGKAWIYLLVALGLVLFINLVCVAGCCLYRAVCERSESQESENGSHIYEVIDTPSNSQDSKDSASSALSSDAEDDPPGQPPVLLSYRPRTCSAESGATFPNYGPA